MNTIRLILGLMIGGIEVAAGRRKGAVSSYTQARERIWSGGKNTTAHHRQGTRGDSCRFGPGSRAKAALSLPPPSAATPRWSIARAPATAGAPNGGRSSYSGMDAQTRACRRPKCAVRNKVADTPALRDEVLALFATALRPSKSKSP
ncbi:MAG: hypothetical protein J6386_20080 [Candidatus Synoicihabitans palmerolidicus]|nr:hypothetical protein [Candidatus Synoicihabitans palmerolidicus]